MNVRLHIDRLVLESIDVRTADRGRVAAAVQAELARLVAAGGISPALTGGIALPSVAAPQISLAPDAKPPQIGEAIAGAVYRGVGR